MIVFLFSAWAAPLLFKVLPFEYERIMDRLIVLLGFFTVYVMYIRGHERELILFGFKGTEKTKWLSAGFVYGLATVVFIVLVEIFLGARELQVNFSKSGPFISAGSAVLTGLAVGLFEEWFFRGFILKSFHRGLSLRWAIFWMNFLYAISHFIEVGNLQGGEQASFVNSLKLMAGFFSQFREPAPVLMQMAGLFIFGYLLTSALLKTGSLYLGMGVHAGVVAAIKVHDRLVQSTGEGPMWFFGDDKYYNGVLGWVGLLLSWFILTKLIDRISWPKQAPLLSIEHPSAS